MNGPNAAFFGSLEPSAQQLIERARQKTQLGHALDILHIILAAYDSPRDGARVAEVSPACMLITQLAQPEQLGPLLLVELNMRADITAPFDGITETLRRCVGAWRQVASSRKVR